jgi:hypothetical protein
LAKCNRLRFGSVLAMAFLGLGVHRDAATLNPKTVGRDTLVCIRATELAHIFLIGESNNLAIGLKVI